MGSLKKKVSHNASILPSFQYFYALFCNILTFGINFHYEFLQFSINLWPECYTKVPKNRPIRLYSNVWNLWASGGSAPWTPTRGIARVQITAFTETCNLKHNRPTNNCFGNFIILPTKIHVKNTFKISKMLGLQGASPSDPNQGALPAGPPPGAPPPGPHPHKLKWNDAPGSVHTAATPGCYTHPQWELPVTSSICV